MRGATISKPVTIRPASARLSTFATRRIVSPSGISLQITAWSAREARGAQRLCQGGLVDRKSVDLVEEERGAPVRVRLRRECGRDEPTCCCDLVLPPVGEGAQRARSPREPRR